MNKLAKNKKVMIYFIWLCLFHINFLSARENHHKEDPYRLQYGDVFIVSVYGEDNSKREVMVSPDGKINYLFVNAVPAGGRTIADIRKDITDKL